MASFLRRSCGVPSAGSAGVGPTFTAPSPDPACHLSTHAWSTGRPLYPRPTAAAGPQATSRPSLFSTVCGCGRAGRLAQPPAPLQCLWPVSVAGRIALLYFGSSSSVSVIYGRHGNSHQTRDSFANGLPSPPPLPSSTGWGCGGGVEQVASSPSPYTVCGLCLWRGGTG